MSRLRPQFVCMKRAASVGWTEPDSAKAIASASPRPYKHLMQILRFLLPLVLVIGPFYCLDHGAAYISLVIIFGVLPILDALIGAQPEWSEPVQANAGQRGLYRWMPWLIVPVLYALVAWGVWKAPSLTGWQVFWLSLSIGTATGGIGITTAHELGHRPQKAERFLSQLLLVLVGYGHFFVEHNRGHHARIGTRDDPATARRDETVYAFWLRSLWFSFAHAVHLERMRRDHQGQSVVHDRVWQLTLASIAFAMLAWMLGGWIGLALFLGQALMAVLLLETVNYLEHYGLTREKGQKVTHVHSWDCNAFLSNSFLFNLERHADHHAHPERPYEALRPTADSPQLPQGYTAMILLSLLPPLWRWVVHPRLDAYQGQA